jgi:hypothetical protein
MAASCDPRSHRPQRHFGFSPFSQQIPNSTADSVTTLARNNTGARLGGKSTALATNSAA